MSRKKKLDTHLRECDRCATIGKELHIP